MKQKQPVLARQANKPRSPESTLTDAKGSLEKTSPHGERPPVPTKSCVKTKTVTASKNEQEDQTSGV
jgi:hypothetical protein